MQNAKFKIQNLFLIIILGSLLFPLISLAGGLVPCGGPGEPRCQFCHLFVMFDNVVDFVLFLLAPPVATLMLVIGGIMFFFAGENPNNIEAGRKIITSVITGLIIIYGAWLLLGLFLSSIGLSTAGIGLIGPDKWFTINCPIKP